MAFIRFNSPKALCKYVKFQRPSAVVCYVHSQLAQTAALPSKVNSVSSVDFVGRPSVTVIDTNKGIYSRAAEQSTRSFESCDMKCPRHPIIF